MKQTLGLSLILLAAACGKVTPHRLADAPEFDTADADPRGPITVHTFGPYGTRAPATGIEVVFTEPSGGRTWRMQSDLDGVVKTEVLPGTAVTAIWLTYANQYQMETVLGAQGGDDIVMAGLGQDYTVDGTFNLSWPPFGGATSYIVGSDCGSTGVGNATSGQITLYKRCASPKQNFYVVAYNASGPAGYLERPNSDYTPLGSLGLTGTYQPFVQLNAQYTNLDPTAISNLYFYHYSNSTFSQYAGTGVTGTAASLVAQVPTASVNAFMLTTVNDSTYTSYQQIEQNTAGNSLAYNLDVGANLAPWIKQPTLDVATGMVTTPVTGSGPIDGGYVRVNYNRAIPTDAGTTNYLYVNWMVIAPTVRDPITLPQLPPELGDLNPKAGDSTYPGDAAIIESEDIAGYDVIRNDLAAAINQAASQPSAGSHIVRVSYAQPND